MDLSKGASYFARAEFIESYATKVFRDLQRDNLLRGRERDKTLFVDRLTAHYTEINALHPFREGNGRATQAFLTQLSLEAGYTLRFNNIGREAWNRAAAASFVDQGPMREVFDQIASPNRAIAFDTQPEREAVAKFPELGRQFRRLEAARRATDAGQSSPAAEITRLRDHLSRELHAGKWANPDDPEPEISGLRD